MKLREVIGFSLQLFLPDKVMLSFEPFSPPAEPGLPLDDRHPGSPGVAKNDVAKRNESIRLIEELDSAQFGGLSFGAESILAMAMALDEALATLPSPVESSRVRELARKILDRAADGERNPARLRQAAVADLDAPEC